MQKFKPKKLDVQYCYIDHLSSYIDQELPKSQMAMVKAHLRICDNCRLELIQLRQVNATLQRAEPISASPEFLGKIWAHTRQKQQKTLYFWSNQLTKRIHSLLSLSLISFLPFFTNYRKIMRLSMVSFSLLVGTLFYCQIPTPPIFSLTNQPTRPQNSIEYVELTSVILAGENNRQLRQLPHPMLSAFKWQSNSLTETNTRTQP